MPDAQAARWLLVSRPIIGPSLDGGPALLRQLIPALPTTERCDYFGDPSRPLRPLDSGDRLLRVPRMPGGRGAELLERAAIGAVLVARERRRQPVHLFLSPGPLTERIAAGLVATPEPISRSRGLARRASGGLRSWLGVARTMVRGRQRGHARPAPVIQTMTCGQGIEGYAALLESLDAVVALSDHIRDRLIGAGVPRARVHRIYPGVGPGVGAITDRGALERRPGLLYAGELDAGAADRLIELARTLGEPSMRGRTLIIACRPGSAEHELERARLARELAGAIGSGRVELYGEVEDMGALMQRCALQLFVADAVHRRIDLPLVVLEGLAAGLPLVALDRAPLRELFTVGQAQGLEFGERVDPGLGPQAVVAAVHRLLDRPERLLGLSEGAVGLASESFSAARMGADYAALHREVLSRYDL